METMKFQLANQISDRGAAGMFRWREYGFVTIVQQGGEEGGDGEGRLIAKGSKTMSYTYFRRPIHLVDLWLGYYLVLLLLSIGADRNDCSMLLG